MLSPATNFSSPIAADDKTSDMWGTITTISHALMASNVYLLAETSLAASAPEGTWTLLGYIVFIPATISLI